MQRTTIILALLFICTNSIAQQYPFVHYTPKDGLISNQIRDIYQDSKGRLYFTSMNGLSVYDGSRFINYTAKNGLGFNIVNCVMEMGEDSIWIVTNSPIINCLVNGKIKPLHLNPEGIIINRLVKDLDGNLYAASEQGLYKFSENRFIKLPFTSLNGQDISRFISYIFSFGDHLLIQRDLSMIPDAEQELYLYDKRIQKVVAEIKKIYTINMSTDGRIWVSTEKKIMALDTGAISRGRFVLQDLPPKYDKIKNLGAYFIIFDQANNCWLGDQNQNLLRLGVDGHLTSFTAESGLNMFFINAIFLDKENITWIATNNGGLNKLVQTNFSLTANPFGFNASTLDLSYNNNEDQLLLYSHSDAKLAIIKNDLKPEFVSINHASELEKIIQTPYGFYARSLNKIYKLNLKGNTLHPQLVLFDSADILYSSLLVDKHGNLIVCGNKNITAIVNGTTICKRTLNFFADQVAMDSKGNIWVVTRAGELTKFSPNPSNAADYLEQADSKEITGFSPRSIIIDKNDNIWIGTRDHGIHVFALKDGHLEKKLMITKANGLSDEFTTYLACDADNNIWASSALGLDKITIKNGIPIVENITKQNNIYQSVFKVVIDKDNTVWGEVSNGIIRITPDGHRNFNYSPTLMITMVKAGKDTLYHKSSFSHNQNSLSFNFAATSFLDEKQITYSYRLQGGTNNQWSEPSNSSTVSFINLPPGNYMLDVQAAFPAGRYASQTISYKFSIAPPWWRTWWFRTVAGLLIIGLLITAFRFYYHRKLEKQMMLLEKQQAVEKERTRIATDMHDDLGAGLSRIKFLSQSLLKKNKDAQVNSELEKITNYSDEMSEKMGEIIWALNEKNDTIADLISYTRSYAVEYLANHNIECEAGTPLHLPATFITGEMRRNIFLSVKECLHNIVKHANASKVSIAVGLDGKLQIVIHDNGKGIDWNNRRSFSNGIHNMEKRMKEIDGSVIFSNDKGTKVSLIVPLNYNVRPIDGESERH